MNAAELFRSGQLDEAIALLNQELREAPLDDGRRTFLFELLCINGQWDRASRVLDAMQEGQGRNKVIYAALLRAESRRRAFLLGEGAPPVLGAPPAGLDLAPYHEAARALERGEAERAFALLDEAEARRSPVAGRRGEQPFADLRDADDRFAPVLEVLEGEEYAWLPFSSLRSLQVQPPRHPIDQVFALGVADLGQGPRRIFIPARYPGTERAPEPTLRLGWKTTTLEGSGVRCLGQRILLVGDQALPLFQVGGLVIGPGSEGAAP